MKYRLVGLVLFSAVALAVANQYQRTRRDLDTRRELIETDWQDVQDDLEQRAALVPALAGALDHEAAGEQAVINLVKAKAALDGADAPNAMIAANERLNEALARYLDVVRRIPRLRNDRAFAAERLALEESENRIAQSRSRYNDAVKAYNQRLPVFPNNLVARIRGYRPLTEDHYFKTDIPQREATPEAHRPK